MVPGVHLAFAWAAELVHGLFRNGLHPSQQAGTCFRAGSQNTVQSPRRSTAEQRAGAGVAWTPLLGTRVVDTDWGEMAGWCWCRFHCAACGSCFSVASFATACFATACSQGKRCDVTRVSVHVSRPGRWAARNIPNGTSQNSIETTACPRSSKSAARCSVPGQGGSQGQENYRGAFSQGDPSQIYSLNTGHDSADPDESRGARNPSRHRYRQQHDRTDSKKTLSNRTASAMVIPPDANAAFVAAMEDVLEPTKSRVAECSGSLGCGRPLHTSDRGGREEDCRACRGPPAAIVLV
jgi:hypothetical protein